MPVNLFTTSTVFHLPEALVNESELNLVQKMLVSFILQRQQYGLGCRINQSAAGRQLGCTRQHINIKLNELIESGRVIKSEQLSDGTWMYSLSDSYVERLGYQRAQETTTQFPERSLTTPPNVDVPVNNRNQNPPTRNNSNSEGIDADVLRHIRERQEALRNQEDDDDDLSALFTRR